MKSVEHTKTFELAQPIEVLFPLFSPEGEKLWVPGWNYKDIMGTPELAEDYVFLTESHDHGSTEAVWIVKNYDQDAYLVEFYKIEPNDKVGVIKVKCQALGPDRTKVEVGYKYIALTSVGEAFVSSFDGVAYEAFVGEWRNLLLRYFETKG